MAETSRDAPEVPPVRAEQLGKTYGGRSRKAREVRALDGVDCALAAGSIVALVGESGCGKSTLARCLALLETPTSGEVWIDGQATSDAGRRQLAAWRPRVQLIFQDAAAAINPRLDAAGAVAEPLVVRRWGGPRQRAERARELMAEVGLAPELATRSAFELSGGQRQRLAIARALAAEPAVLILDEALSALDLSLRAQMVNLLLDLRERFGLTYLLISHDLRTVAHLADEVAVLDRGRLVERAAPARLLARPRHAKTRELVAALADEIQGTASPGSRA